MMGSFGLLALALTIAPVQDVIDFDRFQLFNNCETMGLVVSVTAEDETAKDVGLTEERVRFAVESRLRGARLFRSGPDLPVLGVEINVVSGAFAVSMRYYKMLFDSVSGSSGFAIAWLTGTTGTHGSKSEFIVSSLSKSLDQFLTEYLRVNESACTESPQPPTQ